MCVGDNKDHCTGYQEVPNEAAPADESVEFLGDPLSPAEATAILNAFFSLEIILSFFIVCLLGVMIKTRKL